MSEVSPPAKSAARLAAAPCLGGMATLFGLAPPVRQLGGDYEVHQLAVHLDPFFERLRDRNYG